MWNWLDVDSNLQTNDSKWLDSFCDLTLSRPDQVWLEKILHDSDSTLTRRACDSDSTKMTKAHHWEKVKTIFYFSWSFTKNGWWKVFFGKNGNFLEKFTKDAQVSFDLDGTFWTPADLQIS